MEVLYMSKYKLWREDKMSFLGAHILLVSLFGGYSTTYSAPVSNPLGFILKVFLHWLSVKHYRGDHKMFERCSKITRKISKRIDADVVIGKWLDPTAKCEPIGICILYPDGRRTDYRNIIKEES